MNDATVFSIFSRCFIMTDRDEWEALSTGGFWEEFLSGVRGLLQNDRPIGLASASIKQIRRGEPFSEFLAEPEVRALFAPPSFEGKRNFAARHFTGGLPCSAPPVESLHTTWSKSGDGAFAGRTGLYMGDAAVYMNDLANSMGIDIPPRFASTPDHLAVELEFISLMLDAGMTKEARSFCIERLEWLGSYRSKLIAIGVPALFYLAIVDLLIGIRERQEAIATVKNASSPHGASI